MCPLLRQTVLYTVITRLFVLRSLPVCVAQSSPLTFIANMDGQTLSERQPVNSLVYALRGSSTNPGAITFSVESPFFDVPDPESGNVVLTQPLDYEVSASANW